MSTLAIALAVGCGSDDRQPARGGGDDIDCGTYRFSRESWKDDRMTDDLEPSRRHLEAYALVRCKRLVGDRRRAVLDRLGRPSEGRRRALWRLGAVPGWGIDESFLQVSFDATGHVVAADVVQM